MAKMSLQEQAQEILKFAEESGVQSNYFFITTFERYQVQIKILEDLKASIEKDGIREPTERQGLCQPSAPAGGSDASPESRSGRTAELLRRSGEAVRELAELIAQAERRKREREEDSFRMRM
mgnify:CR=1 FL=1